MLFYSPEYSGTQCNTLHPNTSYRSYYAKALGTRMTEAPQEVELGEEAELGTRENEMGEMERKACPHQLHHRP